MQTRHYEEKDGLRIWLSRDERAQLLDVVDSEENRRPRRRVALLLAMSGLRTDEVLQVEPQHFREMSDGSHVLQIEDGKTGRREVPVAPEVWTRVDYLRGAARLRQDEPIVDVAKRTVRSWIEDAREELAGLEDEPDDWADLGMHDLRRTWATDTYYSLAIDGVPIAEQLTMSWGGWQQTEAGIRTFRRNYLGPIPDHVTKRAVDALDW